MSDKPPKTGIGNLMGNWGRTAAKPLKTSTRRCEAGHPMDKNWAYCPYCKAAGGAGERTQAGFEPAAPASRVGDGVGRQDLGATRINSAAAEDAPGQDAHGDMPTQMPRQATRSPMTAHTRILPESDLPPPAAAGIGGGTRPRTAVLDVEDIGKASVQRRSNNGRRLTGILVTYTWSAQGHLYEVREGRNFAGSGKIAAEGHRDADILVGDDPALSSSHFLILCQSGQYRISDCHSTNGTFVNGQLIDPLGIELADNALIKAGDTLLVFKKLTAPTARSHAQERPPTSAQAPAPRQPDRSSSEDDHDDLM